MTFYRPTTKFLSCASNTANWQLDVRDGHANPFLCLVVEERIYVSGHFIVASLVVELIKTYGSERVWLENAGALSLAGLRCASSATAHSHQPARMSNVIYMVYVMCGLEV